MGVVGDDEAAGAKKRGLTLPKVDQWSRLGQRMLAGAVLTKEGVEELAPAVMFLGITTLGWKVSVLSRHLTSQLQSSIESRR